MLGMRRQRWKVWFFVLLAGPIMVTANIALAVDNAGKLRLTVMFDNKPIKAVAVVRTGQKEKYVLQTNGGKMKQTPLDVAIPAGKYALYVRADIHIPEKDFPFQIRMQTKALPIEIRAGGQLNKTVTIPAGRLRISTDVDNKDTDNMRLGIAGVSTYEGEIPGFKNLSTTEGRLSLPVDIRVPPGSYHYQVSDSGKHKEKEGLLKAKAGKTLVKRIYFRDVPEGFLGIYVIKDGKPLSPSDYQQLEIAVKSYNGEELIPFSGNNVSPMKLPVGSYDVIIPVHAIGGKKEAANVIRVEKDKTTVRNIVLHQPGILNIRAQWTHQPANIGDCVHYYNPLNAAHLGALMGGHSVSRGKCLNPTVTLAAWVSQAGHDGDSIARIKQVGSGSIASAYLGGKVTKSEPVSTMNLVPGSYDITVWPVGYQALQQTLKNVDIRPGSVLQKDLEFRWPEKNTKKAQ